jgi:cytochrome c5
VGVFLGRESAKTIRPPPGLLRKPTSPFQGEVHPVRCSRVAQARYLIAMLSSVCALLAASATARAQTLPQGEGRELVATACSQCHTLAVIVAGRDGPVGWKRHVYNMVLRGAQLTPREAQTVIDYLIANFGPGAPVAPSAPLPSGPGKDLVETRCAVCHSLERVTIVKRDKRDWENIVASMYDRWGVNAPAEVQAINGYLAAQFGR